MLFSKENKTQALCALCLYCEPLAGGEDRGFCSRKGPVSLTSSCRTFRYDPTRRIPPRPLTEEEMPRWPEEETSPLPEDWVTSAQEEESSAKKADETI